MKKIISSKKGLLLLGIIVIVLIGFIGLRSGAAKLTLNTSKTNPSSQNTSKTSPTSQSSQAKIPAFTLVPPPNWQKMDPNSAKGEVTRFESKEVDSETVKNGSVTTNAVISLRMAGSYRDLDDFVSQYQASGTKAKGYQQLDSSPLDKNGYRLEIKYQTTVGGGSITIHELNYLFFKDGFSFLIRGYSSDAAWDKHINEIKTALDSFRFK